MKAIITRTSTRSEILPCTEAKEETLDLTYLDYRTVKTLEEAKGTMWYEGWHKRGTNHREEKGMVVCDVKKREDVYTIEIKDLNDLIELHNKYGDLVIIDSKYQEIQIEIEIYDGYRE